MLNRQIVPLLLVALTSLANAARPTSPNIVLLLTDDLGWQDVKCYDIDEPSPMETPNIDALAKKGVMFWQAYSPSPVCAPSRAAILSGQHPVRVGMTSVSGGGAPHFWNPTRAGTTAPYNSPRIPASTVTLAEALKAKGYATGHSGKWHIEPQPPDLGFDSNCQHRGVQGGMPNRLTGFATRDSKDPFRLDENGFPYDVPQHEALKFLNANKDRPFFLYYATWLVHAPISMKSEQLLQKYVKKLGVELKPEHRDNWPMEGQTNPFYCAMVEQLDYFMGQIFTYLETTEDPRWPGHMLSENTYVFFTSDNGGMENRPPVDRYTENAPLDRGKISTKEGGVRVPLIITGPNIPANVQSDVMLNGLDFYPTILALTGIKQPEGQIYDGCDLVPLLTTDPTDRTLVRDASGNVRDTMFWHFPQMEGTTAIRIGDYKLRRSCRQDSDSRELYRLYRIENGKQVRVDIEEEHNLAETMPEKVAALEAKRAELVAEMNGRYAHMNPDWHGELAGKETAPRVLSHTQTGAELEITYQNRGAKVVYADLIYTLTGGTRREEWLRADMTLEGNDRAHVRLPIDTTHYFVNLVDENHFLVVYPKIDAPKLNEAELPFSAAAVFVGYGVPEAGDPVDFGARFEQLKAGGGGALLAEDFEGETTALAPQLPEGVAFNETVAVSGKRCLEILDVEGLERPWMPLVGLDIKVPEGHDDRTVRVAFDVMLDSERPGVLSMMLRDEKSGTSYASGGNFVVGDGMLKGNEKIVGRVQPGTWCHMELSFKLGAESDKMFNISLATADGRTFRRNIPYENRAFNCPTWLGWAGVGSVGSRTYIDNVVCRVE